MHRLAVALVLAVAVQGCLGGELRTRGSCEELFESWVLAVDRGVVAGYEKGAGQPDGTMAFETVNPYEELWNPLVFALRERDEPCRLSALEAAVDANMSERFRTEAVAGWFDPTLGWYVGHDWETVRWFIIQQVAFLPDVEVDLPGYALAWPEPCEDFFVSWVRTLDHDVLGVIDGLTPEAGATEVSARVMDVFEDAWHLVETVDVDTIGPCHVSYLQDALHEQTSARFQADAVAYWHASDLGPEIGHDWETVRDWILDHAAEVDRLVNDL